MCPYTSHSLEFFVFVTSADAFSLSLSNTRFTKSSILACTQPLAVWKYNAFHLSPESKVKLKSISPTCARAPAGVLAVAVENRPLLLRRNLGQNFCEHRGNKSWQLMTNKHTMHRSSIAPIGIMNPRSAKNIRFDFFVVERVSCCGRQVASC